MNQFERDEKEMCQRWHKFLSSNSQLNKESVTKTNLQEMLQAFQAEKIIDEKLLVQIFYISTGWLPNKIEIQELNFANVTGGLIAVEEKI